MHDTPTKNKKKMNTTSNMSRELSVISCIAFPELGRRLVRYANCSLCNTVPQNGFDVTLCVTVLLSVRTEEVFRVSVDLTNITDDG
jgi:hypothetical protein